MEFHEWISHRRDRGLDSGRGAGGGKGGLGCGVGDRRIVVSLGLGDCQNIVTDRVSRPMDATYREIVTDTIVNFALGVNIVLKGVDVFVQ